MPKLDGTGPEGKGSASGRKLGNCNKELTDEEKMKVLGVGMGKRRKEGGGDGQKKRLKGGKQ
ncbi:MAG: DUF5320 family protein [Paludibacter sp.]|nr:DUF5320 family protein [Paludibacter sp.]